MRRAIALWVVFLFVLHAFPAPPQTGRIIGQVTTSTGQPLAGISGFAKGPNGTIYSFTTNANGQYALNELPLGRYSVWIKPPGGLIVIQPMNGVYQAIVRHNMAANLPFVLRTTGISMDFGKPPPHSRPGGGKPTKHFEKSSDAATAFFLRNPNWTDMMPDHAELIGSWKLFPASAEEVWISNVLLNDPSGTASVTYENLGGNNFRIEIYDPDHEVLTDEGYLMRVILQFSSGSVPVGHTLFIGDGLSTFEDAGSTLNWCPITGLINDLPD